MTVFPRLKDPGKGLWLLALPLILTVSFSFFLPYGASFWKAFDAGGEITVTENSTLLRITLFTLRQAFFSVLVSLALGLPGAWFIGTRRSRLNPALRTMMAIPFAMPSILVVLGFVLFFGNSGWANRLMGFFTGRGDSLRILYRPEAIILAHAFYNFPLVIRLVGDGLAGACRAYTPAAASLGASPARTALRVILPLSLPALWSAALLVFLYSFTSFAVVLVLGGGPASTTLAVEIYRHSRIFLNYRNAGALALLETLIAVFVYLLFIHFSNKSKAIKSDIQEAVFENRRTGFSGFAMSLYFILAALFVLGPILSVVFESFLFRPSRSAARVLSLRWYSPAINAGGSFTFFPALFRSLALAFFSSTFACVLAILAAAPLAGPEAGRGKQNRGLSNIVRFFATAPVISSGIVLGLGWLIMYGRSSSPAALVMLHGVIALPFAFNSISEGFRSLPADTLKAAAVFGAGPFRTLFTMAIPLSYRRIRSVWGFAAALSLGELNAAMMLGMNDWETLPLYIFRAAGAYRYGNACAAGTLLILCSALCFLLSETGISDSGSAGKKGDKNFQKPNKRAQDRSENIYPL
jgi:thiamine transport system permease protein